MSAQVVVDEEYQLRHERVAGLDIAKADAVACLRLPPEEGKQKRASRVWTVRATVPDIEELAAELGEAGVEKVSMESTSDYWRIWFLVLEAAGLSVQLVNSSQARNLPGRPKTDRADAQWIARLTEMGLLRPSFVPPPEIRALRQYTRQLARLTADRTRYWQRLEKLLEDALCKVSSVVSKMAGSKSVRAMLQALIDGQRDPRELAGLALGSMRGKRAELERAFTGMRFEAQHAFAAASHLRMIDYLDAEITMLEEQVKEHLAAIPAAWGVDADGTTGPEAGRGPDAVVLPAADRLAEVDGLGWFSAAALIAEIGLDMSVFPTPEALVSWVGQAPVAAQSGPRKGRGKKGRGNSYARRIASGAGNGAARTGSFLGERHRRIRSRPGSGWNKASCAVGRSVLVIVWHLLSDPADRYRDLGPDHYATHASTGRKISGHIRQLEALGLEVTVTPREEAA
ncbi:MAG: IS110 family transposase [Actinobacteria bacterium]|nr:IS110 family transposase [Actinomycetota bacterium]